MLELTYEAEGRPHRFRLVGHEVSLGRSSENEVVLNDFSVSRKHAVLRFEEERWVLYDQNSTNGVKVNGRFVTTAPVAMGDVLTIGTFTLNVKEEAPTPAKAGAKSHESTSTFVRSIADFNRDFNLDLVAPAEVEPNMSISGRRMASPGARGKIFEILVQVAKTLIVAREVNEILGKVVDLLFDFLPVERAAVVLLDDNERPVPTLARQRGRDGVEVALPFSHTIVDTVVKQRVAVLTSDALADGRFEAGQSIRIQQIRSAMCVPLWNRDRIIGALHVDTPLKVGTFTADDLDLLTALGNFAAVALERARLQKRIEKEERIRERLSRYHSPGVVEEIASETTEGVEKVRTRHVTIFFADIVGFTTAAETMDPEFLSRFLGTVFTFAADAIFAQGGTLDKFIGDAVMAFFGAPIPQPDHPRRAIAAAARLVEQVMAWNAERTTRKEPPVAVRIGMNTGNAVVGDIGSDKRVDYTVLGNTVNIAARLEEYVAGPNEIVVGEETARLAGDFFQFEPLGEIRLKGLTKGLPAFRVKLDSKGVPLPPKAS
ncbi:MAG TPA: adenylate/guanylate cyclase domain-containing protein [Thermoanaerobaculia bacterium]|nr:adenylate/guanylate cyclase domain-containing protein [Thermoanaerobaculia bacterium]